MDLLNYLDLTGDKSMSMANVCVYKWLRVQEYERQERLFA